MYSNCGGLVQGCRVLRANEFGTRYKVGGTGRTVFSYHLALLPLEALPETLLGMFGLREY